MKGREREREGAADETLSLRMRSALKLIESGGVPAVVVNTRDDDDDDDGGDGVNHGNSDSDSDSDDIGVDMLNIVVRRPDVPPATSFAALSPDAALAHDILRTVSSDAGGTSVTSVMTEPGRNSRFETDFSDITGQKFAALLHGVSPSMHDAYHTQALQAEIDFKHIVAAGVTGGPVALLLRHAYQASNHLGKEILKYKTLLAWHVADVKAETESRQHILKQHLTEARSRLAAQKKIQRAEIQRLVDAWVSTVGAYRDVLADSSTLLKEMTKGKDASVISESSRIAALLVAAIDEILQETVLKVGRTDDPQDMLRLLETLKHAIEASTARVETVLKDCVGTRPDFDRTRHQELEDALSKTRSDISKATLAMTREDDALLTPGLTLDREYTIRQTQAGLRARLEASRRLEAILATDLRDADVQSNITALHHACQRQITWKATSDKLAALCWKKHSDFKRVYSAAAREQHIEEEVARKECDEFRDGLREKEKELRHVLVSGLTSSVAAYAEAVAELSSSGGQASASISDDDRAKVKKITAALLSRVLLEYAMLA